MAENQTVPHEAEVGDQIEHELLPGFVMEVRASRACEQDPARPKVHLAYQVTDPEGQTDWLCAYDVRASQIAIGVDASAAQAAVDSVRDRIGDLATRRSNDGEAPPCTTS